MGTTLFSIQLEVAVDNAGPDFSCGGISGPDERYHDLRGVP